MYVPLERNKSSFPRVLRYGSNAFSHSLIMELPTIDQIQNFHPFALAVLTFLLICVVVGACTLLYVGVQATSDGWKKRNIERSRRETWLAEKAALQRTSK
jgi:hypothetical protein